MKNKLIYLAMAMLLLGCEPTEEYKAKVASEVAAYIKEIKSAGSGQNLIEIRTKHIKDVFDAIKKDGGKVVALCDRRGGIVHLVYEK